MSTSQAQTIPVTPFSFDEDLRFFQLQGKLPIENSLTIRPILYSKKFTPDSLYRLFSEDELNTFHERKITFLKKWGKASILPISSVSKFTSHHPYGWSDGLLMPINGFQQYFRTGAYLNLGPFFVIAQPELLIANNREYETTLAYGDEIQRKPIRRIHPGQSKIGFNIGPLTAAASTENIWWGSGIQSSLLMTNNASGFFHLSFNTNRPIKTPIGNFEWQIIAGKADGDNDSPEEALNMKSLRQSFNNTISNEPFSKYINAITVTYTPKFLKGVSVGGTRAFISSSGNLVGNIVKEVGVVKAYLPIFDGLFKEKRISFEDSLQWNQIISIHAKVTLPTINAELYGEYGWNDHKFNVRDLLMTPAHSTAYIIGARKIFSLPQKRYIDFSVELNQMAPGVDEVVRVSGAWYTHYLKSIYSHRGEVLGSGIGFGSNLLRISSTVRKNYNKIEFFIEQLKHDPPSKLVKWSDIAAGINGRYKLKSFLFNLSLTAINSRNYGWEQDINRFNFMGMMGVSYFF
jgi:hypothetical protein